ncbi:MAG: D-alanyl-D-alanine carboxypeptidase family protein [Bacteroidota bacterium]
MKAAILLLGFAWVGISTLTAQPLDYYRGKFGGYEEVLLTLREQKGVWEGRVTYVSGKDESKFFTLEGRVSSNGRFYLAQLDRLGKKGAIYWEGKRSANQIKGLWVDQASGQTYYFTLNAYQPPRPKDKIDSLQQATIKHFNVTVPRYRIFFDHLGFPVGVPTRFSDLLEKEPINVLPFPSALSDTTLLYLREDVYWQFQKLRKISPENIDLKPVSAFRGLKLQAQLHKKYGIQRFEASGNSEHHLATCLDFKGITKDSETFCWLLKNAFSYGWIPSYYFQTQTHKERQPGHWRYVGKTTALAFRQAWKLEIEELCKP